MFTFMFSIVFFKVLSGGVTPCRHLRPSSGRVYYYVYGLVKRPYSRISGGTTILFGYF